MADNSKYGGRYGLYSPKLDEAMTNIPGLSDIVKGIRDEAAQRQRKGFKTIEGGKEDE